MVVICSKFVSSIFVSTDEFLQEYRYIVSQKHDTGVAHYNFNAHQPILVSFDRDVAERVCYQMVICYPTCPN